MHKYTVKDWSCRVCGAPQPMMDHTGKSIFSVVGGECPSCGTSKPVYAIPRWRELNLVERLLVAGLGLVALLAAIAIAGHILGFSLLPK